MVLEKVVQQANSDGADSQGSSEKLDKGTRFSALSVIAAIAKAFLSQESWVAPVSLFTVVLTLHGEIFALSDKPKVQDELSDLCETWFIQDRSSRDALAPQMVSYLLARALATDSKQTDMKRLFLVREALTYLDLEDESTLQLRIMVQRAFLHTQFLAAGGDNFGRRFLIWAFVSLPLVSLLHKTMKNGLISAPKWKREAYANVYFRAWQTSEGPFKLRVEAALTNLVDSAIHVQNPSARKAAESILQYFVDQKAIDKNVEDLLHRLYSPLLFHALEVANPNVRENALRQLGIVFPLVPPVLPQGEFDEALEEQFHTLVDSLEDRAPNVRSQAILSIGRILATFWDILPAQSIHAILNHMTEEMAFDRASPLVRESVFRILSAIIEQAPASHRLFAERGYMGKLEPLIFDTSEKVRIACANLLETVKKIRVIKFYEVVEFDTLLEALGNETSEKVVKSIVRVLQASYWPYPRYPVEDIVLRAVTLINTNPKAAITFYKHAKLVDPVVAMNFMVQLWNNHLVPLLQEMDKSVENAPKKATVAKKTAKKASAKKSASKKKTSTSSKETKIVKKKVIVKKIVKVMRPKSTSNSAGSTGSKAASGSNTDSNGADLNQSFIKRVRWADEEEAEKIKTNNGDSAASKEEEMEEVEEEIEEEIEVEEEVEVDGDDDEEIDGDGEFEPSAKRAKIAEAPLSSNKESVIAIMRIVAALWERVEGTVKEEAVLSNLFDSLSQENVLASLQRLCPDSSLSKIASRLPARILKRFATDSIAQVTDVGLTDSNSDGGPSLSQRSLLPCIFAWEGDYAKKLIDAIAKLIESKDHSSQVLGTRLVANILNSEFSWVRDIFNSQAPLFQRVLKALKSKIDDAYLLLDGEKAFSHPHLVIECLVLRLKLLLHHSYSQPESGSELAKEAFEETAAWLETGVIPKLQEKTRKNELELVVEDQAPADMRFGLQLSTALIMALNDYDTLLALIESANEAENSSEENSSSRPTTTSFLSRSIWKITESLLKIRSDKESLSLAAAVGWKLLSRETQSPSKSILPSHADRASFTLLLLARDQTPDKRLSISALRTLCKQRNEFTKIVMDRLWTKVSELLREEDYSYEVEPENLVEGELEPILNAFGGAAALMTQAALWIRSEIERAHRAPASIWTATQLCSLLSQTSSKRPNSYSAIPLRSLLSALFASMRQDDPTESILRSRLDQLLKTPAFAKR